MARRPVDLETQLKDLRRQLNDQLGCLEFRMESKLSLLSEFQEFFKKRGEVEYEYARALERLCEKFEKNTKQRNIRNEVRSTFNLWTTLLVETRKLSRERATLAEVLASEMLARLEIVAKDAHVLTKKCKEICIDVQDQFLKELRDLSEALNKLTKSKEKLEATRGQYKKKKAQEKELERQRHFRAQKHLLLKNRNEYLLGITRCNACARQYFNMDVMDIIEYMDFDYHNSFKRLAGAYREAEHAACDAVMHSADQLVEQAKNLNFENDLHYFLSEYAQPFTPPNLFLFMPFEGDDEYEFKVNTEDVFRWAQKTVEDLTEEVQTLEIQKEEDVKTVQHMEQVNLRKYQVTTVDDALATLEESGEPLPFENSGGRGTASLERGLAFNTKGGQAIQMAQKGKKDNLFFMLTVLQRRIVRSNRLYQAQTQLNVLEQSLDAQKVPPVPVGVDKHGHSIPGEVPRLFGGNVLEYIMATGCEIPLIVQSCVKAIEKDGLKMEGLFRVPGPAGYMDELRKGFEEGRDPLAYSTKKVDIAAVASILKAYFRELSVPLFPTNKYTAFIECTRREDLQDRVDSIRDTVNSLHPAVVTVMRFLFKFMNKVIQNSSENKMGSSNLALVFGPTLTRAPDSLEPRQLHNDVPTVNMLIQLCIDHNEYIFGEEEEEEEAAMREGSLSPTPHTSSPLTPADELLPEPEPSPPVSPALPHTDQVAVPEEPVMEDLPVEPVATPPEEREGESPQEMTPSETPPPVPKPAVIIEQEPPPMVEERLEAAPPADTEEGERVGDLLTHKKTGMGRQVSGSSLTQEMRSLDETLKDIEASLVDMEEEEGQKEPHVASNEHSEEESESEEEDVLKIDARALYDYTARSDKELTFKRGDLLQVIEKTPDHNWWDGFHQERRGFIPVAYIEITEVQQVLSRPPPPERRSSMQTREEEKEQTAVDSLPRVSEPPQESTIREEKETYEGPEPVKTPEVMVTMESGERGEGKQPEEEPSKEAAKKPTDVGSPKRKPEVPIYSGAVRSLTQQFQQETQQQRVLVEPHSVHRRQLSDYGHRKTPSSGDADSFTRAHSTGNKVSTLSSAFESKVVEKPPPPIKPKPHVLSPGADQTAFPIAPHSFPSASPLQKAALGLSLGKASQTSVPRKPAPPPSKPIKKGSVKRKSAKEKDKQPASSKPVVPLKPPIQGFVPPPGKSNPTDRTAKLHAELQAAAFARRQANEDLN